MTNGSIGRLHKRVCSFKNLCLVLFLPIWPMGTSDHWWPRSKGSRWHESCNRWLVANSSRESLRKIQRFIRCYWWWFSSYFHASFDWWNFNRFGNRMVSKFNAKIVENCSEQSSLQYHWIFETKKDKFRMDSRDVRFWFKLFSELHQTKRVFINCGNKGDSYGRDRSESGIVTYHAYSVLDVAKVKLNNGRSASLGLCWYPYSVDLLSSSLSSAILLNISKWKYEILMVTAVKNGPENGLTLTHHGTMFQTVTVIRLQVRTVVFGWTLRIFWPFSS